MRALHILVLPTAAAAAFSANVSASADTPVAITYVPNSLAEARIADGPWTLHQKVGRNPHDASGILPPSTVTTPFNPPTTAYGTPYKNYCVNGRVQSAQGINPMQPYYFPFVRKSGKHGGGISDYGNEQQGTPYWQKNSEYLEGFFDYRPRNEQEATVAAISLDWGKSWIFEDEALGLNPYCPADPTDPDNNNVVVNGVSTAYGSDPDNAADNGLGHAFVMTVGGVQFIYNLNRATGHIDSDPLVVHALKPKATHPLASLPEFGYVSPLASGGYSTLNQSFIRNRQRGPDPMLIHSILP